MSLSLCGKKKFAMWGFMTNMILVNQEQTGITVLTLNRPEKRNALNIYLMQQLKSEIEECCTLGNQRVIILKGAGQAFCTGLDLNEANDPSLTEQSSEAIASLLKTIYNCPLATIATIHGIAAAGGAGIASACDFIVAAHDTKIGFPEVHRGIIPAIVSVFLRRQLAEHDLRELLLLGNWINAEKAKSMHLVHQIVPSEKLDIESIDLAKLVMKGGPESIAKTKQLLTQLYPISIEENIKVALDMHKSSRKSKEAKEGIQAFLEKRNPIWDDTQDS